MKILIPFTLTLLLTFFSSCTRTANKTGPLVPYPEVTADIEIGDQVRGEGTRAELLGFIRWGDPGRATFTARKQEHELGGAVVKQSMQSAVYDALGGQPDHFIVDPHFHTVEHNFLVFKTAKTSVVGRKAKHDNYRQVKKYNSDGTETLLLEDSPQTITIDRNGREATKLVTSGNITDSVTDSVNVYDTSSGVRMIDADTPEDRDAVPLQGSIRELEAKLQDLNRRINSLK